MRSKSRWTVNLAISANVAVKKCSKKELRIIYKDNFHEDSHVVIFDLTDKDFISDFPFEVPQEYSNYCYATKNNKEPCFDVRIVGERGDTTHTRYLVPIEVK